ncbi:MAG TPA: AsmA-like C-terminal domain-containing protein, partial [Candidatus Acidoferrum sp.]|nr:AsmA-like C-terminal domain-containing protein [Candidatus Acidoferrum sp.]
MIRRSSRLLLEVLAAVLAGFLVLGGLATWRLSQDEPIRLTFLTPYIVDALTPADGSFKVAIDDTVLTWGGWARTIDLRATGLHVQDANGRTVAAIPALSLTLSARALLLHRLVAPTAIEIFQPRIFIVREADGHFRFVHAAPGDPSQPGDETSPVLTRLLQTLLAAPDPSLPTGYLKRASITDGQLTLIDRKAGVTWHAPAANITLGRDVQGIVGQLDLSVERLGDPAKLNAVAVYDAGKQRLMLTANMSGVHAGALAAIDPVLARFSGADVTLSGKLTSSMDLDGRILGTTFDLTGGAGTLAMPGTFEVPLAIRSLALSASFDPASDRLTLAKAELQLDGPRLQASGTIDGVHAGAGMTEDMRIGMKLAAEDIDLAELPHYWPVKVKPNPRGWIASHLTEGVARADADVALTLPGGDPDATVIEQFAGTVTGSGVAVHYLDPLPPVEGAAGTAHFTREEFTADFTHGHVQGVQVDGGTLRISGLQEPDQIIDIEAKMHGQLTEALAILDNPRLGYAKKLGIDPAGVGGTVAATLTVNLPAKKGVTFDQIKLGVTADIADAAIKNAMLGQDLSNGDAKLQLDHDGMTLAGTGKFGGAPLEFKWEENFGGGDFTRRLTASGPFDAAQRAALGYDLRPYVDGPIDTAVVFTRLPKKRSTVDIKLNLESATLKLPPVKWTKPPGTHGDAHVLLELAGDHVHAIPDFSIAAGDLAVAGKAQFGDDNGGLSGVAFDKLKLGRTDLKGVTVAFNGGRADVVIAGGEVDAAPLVKRDDTQPEMTKPPFTLRASSLSRVYLGDESLSNVAVTLRHDGHYWDEIVFDASLPDQVPLSVRYQPNGGKHQLSITSTDAGAVLRTFDIVDNVKGGTLTVTGEADDKAPGRPLTGKAEIADFRLVKASILARLLTMATLTGFVDVLTGEGFQFNRFESDFTKTEGRLDIKLARAHGPSIGLTGTGYVDFDQHKVDMKGTVVPAYALNGILNDIPILGFVLTGGEGEGMFAVTYHATGPLEQPEISVNPLSALTPGFLRGV